MLMHKNMFDPYSGLHIFGKRNEMMPFTLQIWQKPNVFTPKR